MAATSRDKIAIAPSAPESPEINVNDEYDELRIRIQFADGNQLWRVEENRDVSVVATWGSGDNENAGGDGRLLAEEWDQLTKSVKTKSISSERIGKLLMPGLVLSSFLARSKKSHEQERRTRIVVVAVGDLARIPWEVSTIEGRTIALGKDTSLVRRLHSARRNAESLFPQRQVSVAIVDAGGATKDTVESDAPSLKWFEAAAPDISRLELDADRESLRAYGDYQGPSHIFHFSGHGDQGGLVVWSSPDSPVSGVLTRDELEDLLKRMKTRLAVISACKSSSPSGLPDWASQDLVERLAGSVPAVIGMRDDVLAKHAREFMESLYNALLKGESLDDAVREGRATLDMTQGASLSSVVLYLASPGDNRLNRREADPALSAILTPKLPHQKSFGREPFHLLRLRDRPPWYLDTFHGTLLRGATGSDLEIPELDSEHISVLSADGRIALSGLMDSLDVAWISAPGGLMEVARPAFFVELPPPPAELAEAVPLTVSLVGNSTVRIVAATGSATWVVSYGPRGWSNVRQIRNWAAAAAIEAGHISYLLDNAGRLDDASVFPGISRVHGIDCAVSGGVVLAAVWGVDRRGVEKIAATIRSAGAGRSGWVNVDVGPLPSGGIEGFGVVRELDLRMPPSALGVATENGSTIVEISGGRDFVPMRTGD